MYVSYTLSDFLFVLRRMINLFPITPSWPEAEVLAIYLDLLILIYKIFVYADFVADRPLLRLFSFLK